MSVCAAFPIVLVGREFWQGLVSWMKDTLIREGTISEKDLEFFHIVDEPEEVVNCIREGYECRCKDFPEDRRDRGRAGV